MIDILFSDASLYNLAMPLVLLYVLCKRFGKMESELDMLKKQIEVLLKNQNKTPIKETTPKESPAAAPIPVEAYQRQEVKKETVEDDLRFAPKEKVAEEPVVEIKEPIFEIKKPVVEVKEPVVEVKEPAFERKEVPVERKGAVAEAEKPIFEYAKKEQQPPVSPQPQKKEINYEKFIGENLFGKIGILVFVVGIGLFVKYAIDQDWINETFRTVLGFFVGSALLTTAGYLQKKYRTFSSLLAGGAFGVFYLTVAIAFHYYHLFSQTAAFLILIGITILMPILAILYDRRELAIISLIGGFLAPFIVSTGEGSYLFLFTYLTILNVGMFGLSIYKKWSELPILSFVFTSLIMGIYIITNCVSEGISSTMASSLFLFCTLFYFIFLLPVISILHLANKKASRVLLTTIIANNFAFLGFGLFLLGYMALPFKAEGLLSLFIAVVNLNLAFWLRKSKQDYPFLVHAMLGLILTFVSITVPLQLSGNYITLFWASEMVLLLWLYVKSRIWVYEYATFVLVCLTFISFIMDAFESGSSATDLIFINGQFATSLFMGLATGLFAWMTLRFRAPLETARIFKYTPWNLIMSIFSILILYCTFMREFCLHLAPYADTEAMIIFNSACILAICYGFRKRFPIKQFPQLYNTLIGVNTLIYILFAITCYTTFFVLDYPLLAWPAAILVIANLYEVSRRYYKANGIRPQYTIYLNVLSTFLWASILQLLFVQLGANDSVAAFSIALSIAGFAQMGLGMRLHQKVLRVISLCTFGIVLSKLVLIDLWAMPTVGKIIVFIILGLILLILSFLYQKLKDVLFKDDENENN